MIGLTGLFIDSFSNLGWAWLGGQDPLVVLFA